MRILAIQETDWIKRGPHQQHHIMERMARKGHEIHVIDYDYLWRESNKPEKIIEERKEIMRAYKISKDADITLIRPGMIKLPVLDKLSILYYHNKEINYQITKFNPDIIVAFGILNAYIGMRLAMQNSIPFVYYLIDHLHNLLPGKLTKMVAKQFEKKTIHGANKVLVINKGLKDYAIEMGGDINKISIIPGGVDLAKFNLNIDRSEIRKKYGVKDGEILLFFMGWIYEFSGMKEVVNSLCFTKNTKIKLMIVGEGDLYQNLIKIRKDERLEDRLILTGKIPFADVPKYISAGDICLLPAYKNEIMMNIVPIKMYEYMAMGKPIIATSLPGITKEFGNDNGVIYVKDPNDALKEAITLYDTNKILEYGMMAYSYIQKNSDWNKIIDDFERFMINEID